MGDVPVLVCTAGALVGKRFTVPETGSLKMGRSDENQVIIADDGVSRFHAELLLQNGSLWLQDAGSRNGVFVNGNRVTTHLQLKVGDEITVAEHKFKVRWDGDADEPAVADGPGEGTAGRRRWFWPFS